MSNLVSQHVGMTDEQSFALAQRVAKCLASSDIVPINYQGNVANCVVALNMAQRIGADPLMVMQNLVVIHGKPTWSSQFLIATFNSCGRFSAIRYEFFGEKGSDSWGCRAYATELSTGEKIVSSDVTIDTAKKEGWYGKKGSKWQSIPQQMLMYRSASWLVRAYAPELSMGLHCDDEVNDFIDVTPADADVTKGLDDVINNAVTSVEMEAVGYVSNDEFNEMISQIQSGDLDKETVLSCNLTDEQHHAVISL